MTDNNKPRRPLKLTTDGSSRSGLPTKTFGLGVSDARDELVFIPKPIRLKIGRTGLKPSVTDIAEHYAMRRMEDERTFTNAIPSAGVDDQTTSNTNDAPETRTPNPDSELDPPTAQPEKQAPSARSMGGRQKPRAPEVKGEPSKASPAEIDIYADFDLIAAYEGKPSGAFGRAPSWFDSSPAAVGNPLGISPTNPEARRGERRPFTSPEDEIYHGAFRLDAMDKSTETETEVPELPYQAPTYMMFNTWQAAVAFGDYGIATPWARPERLDPAGTKHGWTDRPFQQLIDLGSSASLGELAGTPKPPPLARDWEEAIRTSGPESEAKMGGVFERMADPTYTSANSFSWSRIPYEVASCFVRASFWAGRQPLVNPSARQDLASHNPGLKLFGVTFVDDPEFGSNPRSLAAIYSRPLICGDDPKGRGADAAATYYRQQMQFIADTKFPAPYIGTYSSGFSYVQLPGCDKTTGSPFSVAIPTQFKEVKTKDGMKALRETGAPPYIDFSLGMARAANFFMGAVNWLFRLCTGTPTSAELELLGAMEGILRYEGGINHALRLTPLTVLICRIVNSVTRFSDASAAKPPPINEVITRAALMTILKGWNPGAIGNQPRLLGTLNQRERLVIANDLQRVAARCIVLVASRNGDVREFALGPSSFLNPRLMPQFITQDGEWAPTALGKRGSAGYVSAWQSGTKTRPAGPKLVDRNRTMLWIPNTEEAKAKCIFLPSGHFAKLYIFQPSIAEMLAATMGLGAPTLNYSHQDAIEFF